MKLLGVSFRTVLISGIVAFLCSGATIFAAVQSNYLGTVFIADPTTLANQLKVNADGSINATAAGGGPSGGILSNGYPLVNTVAPFTVTTGSTSVTGLTLPGKVRFQTSPVSTLGSAPGNTVSVQINYGGGNACTAPDVILLPGQIDDWIYIATGTAPTACAASSGGILLAAQ